jgi:hypothetical protein
MIGKVLLIFGDGDYTTDRWVYLERKQYIKRINKLKINRV